MPYRLKAQESVPDGLKRIVIEEIDDALQALRKTARAERDASIHCARKDIKKIRGLLKLLRPELGGSYKKENATLRDAGRGLSALRDGSAVLQSIDCIAEKYKHELRPHGLEQVRAALEREKQALEEQLHPDAVMRKAAQGLKGLRRRVPKWPLSTESFKAVEPGLRKIYRDGRRAMRDALVDQTPESYHEWRKRAKDHWYHVRLLEKVWPEGMQAREKSLHDLERWLGDDHNLYVVRCELQKDPERFGGEEEVSFFLALAEREQAELRQKAIDEGRRLYQQKPREFAAHLKGLWEVWREQKPRGKGPQRQPAKRAAVKPSAVA